MHTDIKLSSSGACMCLCSLGKYRELSNSVGPWEGNLGKEDGLFTLHYFGTVFNFYQLHALLIFF